jgi:hypothetical protein
MSAINKDDGGVPAKDGSKQDGSERNREGAEDGVVTAEPPSRAGRAAQEGATRQRRAPTVQEGRRKPAPDFGFLSRGPSDEAPTDTGETSDATPSGRTQKDSAPAENPPPAGIHPTEWPAFAVHLKAEPRLIRPTTQAPEPPDPAQERARIERELGVPALVSSLARFGTPPVAPPATKVDRDVLKSELLAATGDKVPRRKLGAWRSLRKEIHERAEKQADAEDERLAAEQEQRQHDLDDQWAELRALRHRAAQGAEAWVEQETRRREATHVEQQAAVDEQWARMLEADPNSVTDELRGVFPNGLARAPDGAITVADGTTTVLGFLDGVAVVAVVCLDRDELIAGTEPPASGGRRRARRRSEERRNDLYLAAVGSRVLAAVGRCFSWTPAVDEVICVAVRAAKAGAQHWEPIYVGSFDRAYADRLLAEGRWSTDPSVLKSAAEGAQEVELELADGSRRLTALDVSDDPGLKAVVEQMDATVTSKGATSDSAQEAVRLFLMGTDAEDDVKEKRGEEDLAHLSGDTTTTHERGARAPSASPGAAAPGRPGDQAAVEAHSEQPAQEPAVQAAPRRDQPVMMEADADPLPKALKDRDASVRRAAVEAIGRRNDPTDTPLLLGALRDVDEIVRLEAMYALRDRLSPDLRRDALVKACSDSDETVRRKAIEALADLGDERDTPVLLRALKDRDDNVRLEAIYAAKHRLRPEMREELIGACDDANEGVRRKAIEALAELGDERDTPLFLKALKDPDSSVRLEAIYALEGRPSLGSTSRLSEPLLEAMQAEDAAVRQAAVRLFGRL